jgi:hypothetical protein
VVAAAFPLVAQHLRNGATDRFNEISGGPIGWTLGLIKGFLPGFTEPWTNALVENPVAAAFILTGLFASLGFSAFLQRRICDRARAAWNVRQEVDGIALDRLRLTGQRQALAKTTLVLIALAIGAWALSAEQWLFNLFAGAAVALGVLWGWRRRRPPGSINPVKPGLLLGFARATRTTPWAVAGYRFVAQKLAPAAFLAVGALIVVALAHRAVFDLASTSGKFCHAGVKTEDEIEKLNPATFRTDSLCHATGIRLVEGRKYRIRVEMDGGVDGEWFDKGMRADVAGIHAAGPAQYMAFPLKRWWRENWFQPVARIGTVGNYEHVLRPAAPLPLLSSKICPAATKDLSIWDAIRDTPVPASTELKTARLECEKRKEIRPSRVLISDITANATGELFLYVNDAVLNLPRLTNVFYRNNSGTAKVTVTRVLAPALEPNDEQPASRTRNVQHETLPPT